MGIDGKLVASDLASRREQRIHVEGDNTILNTVFDAEPAILAARAHRDHIWSGNYKGTKDLGMTLAGIIPMTLWMKLRREGVLQDPVALQKWLNQNPAFKATEGNAISQVKR
jgi:hypothetical protein